MANFFVVSRAKPKPGYGSTGLKHLKTLAEFSTANGAVHAEVGMISTGLNAGSLVALQFFEKMAGIENIYDKLHIPSKIVSHPSEIEEISKSFRTPR